MPGAASLGLATLGREGGCYGPCGSSRGVQFGDSSEGGLLGFIGYERACFGAVAQTR